MTFHGDETYLGGALYSTYPKRVADGSDFIAENRWQDHKTYSFPSAVLFLLSLHAFGEMADELLLSSTRVTPGKLEASKYPYRHRELEPALRHLLGR